MADTDQKDAGPYRLDIDKDAELVAVDTDAYFENEEYVPDPLHQYGTLDTSDTAGGAHQDIREISPTFEAARAQNLRTAVRALDPDDPEVGEDLVVLPQNERTADDGRRAVERSVKALIDNPVKLGAVGPNAAAAAEEREDADNEDDGRNETPRGAASGNESVNPAGTASPEARSSAAARARQGRSTTQK